VNFSFVRQNSTGNVFPWMSPARTGTTYSSQDWLMDTYSAGAPEWNIASTYNAGDRIKYTNAGKDSCLFAIDQTTGVSISGVRGYNETSYGSIGAIFRGMMKNVSVEDVVVSVNCDYILRVGPVPVLSVTTRPFSRSQNIRASRIDNLGTTIYVLGSDGPVDVLNPYTPYYLQMENIGIQQTGNIGLVTDILGTITTASAATMWMHIRNISNGGSIAGTPVQLVNRAITEVNTPDPGGFKTLLAGGLHIKQHQNNTHLKLERTGVNAGASEIFANSSGLNCSTTLILPNAAWNGSLLRLGPYRLWIDLTGKLRIKPSNDPTSDTDGTVVGTQT